MEAPLTISCPDFWTSLVLKSILEERGVLVQPPQEQVFLTLTVSGPRDVIKTAVGELQDKYRRSSPIYIQGMEPVPSAPASTNGAYAPAAEVPAAEAPAAEAPAVGDPAAAPTLPSPAPQRCASYMAGGSQCRLPAVPGGTKCVIHISTREDWHLVLPQP